MTRGVARRVGGWDKFGLINLSASADLSHVGDLANLTYILLGSCKTATNLMQNCLAKTPSNLVADILAIWLNLL